MLARIAPLAVCILLASSPYTCFAQDVQPTTTLEPLRLDQAVDIALGKNYQIKNGLLEVRISKDRISSSKLDFLPEVKVQSLGGQLLTPLNFRFKKGSLGRIPGGGPIPDENVSVTTNERPFLFINAMISQPIIQMGRTAATVAQNKLAKSIAEQKLAAQRQQTANQVKRAYYQALELEGTLKVVEATRTLYLEVKRTTDRYLQEKTVLPADAIEVKQQLATVEYEATKTKNALATQKEEINHLLGRNPELEFTLVPVESLGTEDMSLPEAKVVALSARAEVKQTNNQLKQVELDKRIKKLEYLPNLNLVVDYLSMFGTQVLPKNVAVVGLFLNWEPFDWGRKHFEMLEKKRVYEQLQNTMKNLDTQITMEVNSSHRKLQECKQYVEVSDLGRQLAMERLRVSANKYKEQAVLLKDVLQAQRDVTKANNQWGQSVLSYYTAKADFEKAIGQE